MYHSKRFSSNFDKETLLIIDKFIKVQYPLRFINSVHNEIQKSTDHGYEYFIISPHSFGITKPFISTERPCRVLNEIKSTDFLKKFWKFVNDGFRLAIAGNNYQSRARYKGDCSCGLCYISKTKHNTAVRWNENNNPN